MSRNARHDIDLSALPTVADVDDDDLIDRDEKWHEYQRQREVAAAAAAVVVEEPAPHEPEAEPEVLLEMPADEPEPESELVMPEAEVEPEPELAPEPPEVVIAPPLPKKRIIETPPVMEIAEPVEVEEPAEPEVVIPPPLPKKKRVVENDVAASQLKSVEGGTAPAVGSAEEVAAGSAGADCLGQYISILEPRHVEIAQGILEEAGRVRRALPALPIKLLELGAQMDWRPGSDHQLVVAANPLDLATK